MNVFKPVLWGSSYEYLNSVPGWIDSSAKWDWCFNCDVQDPLVPEVAVGAQIHFGKDFAFETVAPIQHSLFVEETLRDASPGRLFSLVFPYLDIFRGPAGFIYTLYLLGTPILSPLPLLVEHRAIPADDWPSGLAFQKDHVRTRAKIDKTTRSVVFWFWWELKCDGK